MKSNKELVIEFFNNNAKKQTTYSTKELAKHFTISRANMSTLLNQLVNDGLLLKTRTRPVLYKLKSLELYEDDTVFENLIGYKGSMKNAIQLAKAALLYPGNNLYILINGSQGCGKTMFSHALIDFIKSKRDTETITIDCRYIANTYEASEEVLNVSDDGLVLIEDIDLVSEENFQISIEKLKENNDRPTKPMIICTCSQSISHEKFNQLRSFFPVQVQLPSINERSYQERMELITRAFHTEVGKIARNIIIEIDALRALMLYQPIGDMKQLLKDIQIGCANAYVRCLNQSGSVYVVLSDFNLDIQKGFLLYPEQKQKIDEIIKVERSYEFSHDSVLVHESHDEEDVYDFINNKFKQLNQRGIDDKSISTIILTDLKSKFQKYNENVLQKGYNREILGELMDHRIIDLVNDFLNDASMLFDTIYPETVFYGLCLHISSLISKNHSIKHFTGEKVTELINNNQEIYKLCSKYAQRIQNEFIKSIELDEIIVLMLFLIGQDNEREHPVVLLAMHGGKTASEMILVAKQLTQSECIFSFDMDLNDNMDTIYKKLMYKIKSIHNGKGVLFLYDMGSLRLIVNTISKETAIPIRSIELPSTLVVLDAARKAEFSNNLDEVYAQVKYSLESYFENTFNYSSDIRLTKEQTVITLCMSGEGGAVQMKNYIEKNIESDITVIPLAVSDKNYLMSQISELRKKTNILCIVGTYDPQLFNIPFVPVTKLFNTPPDRLEYLFYIRNSTENIDVSSGISYIRGVAQNLHDELENVDVDGVVDMIVDIIKRLSIEGLKMTIDQKVGFLMHVACATDRLIIGEQTIYNTRTKTIISRKKGLYNSLKDLLNPIEKEFCVIFDDSEIANMIVIISKI